MRQTIYQTPDPDTRLILEKGKTQVGDLTIGGEPRENRLIAPLDVPAIDAEQWFGTENLRAEIPEIPDLAEPEVVRHFTALSNKNFGVETGPYPLGSCTMKYNPKVQETLAALPGFAQIHPLQPDATVQGTLSLMADLEAKLCAICGVDRFTFQPSAGAHGEWTGLLMIKAFHESRGDQQRNVMLVPDSAHGTNPASAAMVGYEVRQIASGPDGMVDLASLEAALDDRCAGLMLTNPNTLGLFEQNIGRIAQLVHDAGGQLYYDGANINAILMQVRPGDMGFDVVHLNLHKSFSTPHGGGGPGSGPVGVKNHLAPFLPAPVLTRHPMGSYYFDHNRRQSVGRVRSFNGSFAVLVRAYAYILANGAEGLREVSQAAVANANYLLARLRTAYDLPYDQPCLHEFVLSGSRQKDLGCSTMDIAKRLIDYGFHPPTVYFPMIVKEAMMIEPTETESLDGLVGLADALLAIAEEVKTNPELLHLAPQSTPISRPDELKAAKDPVLRA